jgi:hypothetical protein
MSFYSIIRRQDERQVICINLPWLESTLPVAVATTITAKLIDPFPLWPALTLADPVQPPVAIDKQTMSYPHTD